MESFTRNNLLMVLMKKKHDPLGKIIPHTIKITRKDKIYYKNKKGQVKLIDGGSGTFFNLDIQELFVEGSKVTTPL